MEGTVKSFNKQKGFGFINAEGYGDIFFHYSSLNVEGFKTVDVGAKVTFTLEETEKGQRATNITIIG